MGTLRHPCVLAPTAERVGTLRTELTMKYAAHGTLEAYAPHSHKS